MEYKQIEHSWKKKLRKELQKGYFLELKDFLSSERKHKNIFPNKEDVFAAFASTPFDKVRVVIVGQDPYHTAGVATGSAFAIHPAQKIPPSLRNIYKEIEADTGKPAQDLGALQSQGVFLLNTILTVEEKRPLSHQKKGWERFTDEVLKALWEGGEKIVFLLWGNNAKKKIKGIMKGDRGHLVLQAGHPSPLSVRFFSGCKHFTKANHFLREEGYKEIDWNKK
ncbi:MAG: Uracil-DNA glycosylase [Chlamydiia bacterium]|nr:Uracil-DNA glycosylase [Chlamydiia bacterium]